MELTSDACVCVCVCVCSNVSSYVCMYDIYTRARARTHTHTHTHNVYTYIHTCMYLTRGESRSTRAQEFGGAGSQRKPDTLRRFWWTEGEPVFVDVCFAVRGLGLSVCVVCVCVRVVCVCVCVRVYTRLVAEAQSASMCASTDSSAFTRRSSLVVQPTRMSRSCVRTLHKHSGRWQTWRWCGNVTARIAASPSSHFR